MTQSPFQQQYEWESEFAKGQTSGVECQIADCTGFPVIETNETDQEE